MTAADPFALLVAEVVARVRAEVEPLRAEVASLRARLEAPPRAREPLAVILGVSLDAARVRERRDPELRRLSIEIGRRRFYDRAEVLAYFKTKANHPRLRAVPGGRP